MNVPLEVLLLVRAEDDEWRDVSRRSLPAGAHRIRFDDLAPGVYQLRLRGRNDGRYFAAKAIVASGETRRTQLEVAPVEVFGRIRLGDIPLSKSVVVLKNREFGWEVAVDTDDAGLFHAGLWQGGSFSFVIRSSALSAPYGDRVEISTDRPMQWDLRLPEARVVGLVQDVRISATHGETTHNRTAQAGADGRFDIAAMDPGSITTRVTAPGYLEGAPLSFTLAENDRGKDVTLSLEPGLTIPLRVIDTAGNALAGASVLTTTDGRLRSRTTTAANGLAEVTLPRGEPATVYAVPREGSFAALRIERTGNPPRSLVVSRATSSLQIVTRTVDGKPIGGVELLMRRDGVLVPPTVAEELEAQQGLLLATDAKGEASLAHLTPGFYEFWPYRGNEESAAIMETSTALLAPITVSVKTGPNRIAVNFNAR